MLCCRDNRAAEGNVIVEMRSPTLRLGTSCVDLLSRCPSYEYVQQCRTGPGAQGEAGLSEPFL